MVPLGLRAEVPALEVTDAGATSLVWRSEQFLGPQGFSVQGIVFEKRGEPSGPLRGHEFRDADVSDPSIKTERRRNRVTHRFPWGQVSLEHAASDDRVDLLLTFRNDSDEAIADFDVRLLEFALPERRSDLYNGVGTLTQDRPVHYNLAVSDAECFVTCESFESPVQFGLSARRIFVERHKKYYGHSLKVQGGAPALKGDTPFLPVLGVPHIDGGESLTLRFVLRFAHPNESDAVVLGPFHDAFHDAQKPGTVWADRRPIGKLVIPGSPMHITPSNPRGWFNMPRLDTATEKGRATLEEKLMELADQSLANMKAADAQGVIVWNIEGGHSFPDVPYGDPRHLVDIAPEMDRLADAFFARFRDAGYDVGVCVRPSMLFYSEDRKRWTHGHGAHDPDHESFDQRLKGVSRQDIEARRVFPVAERLSAKIAYAKKRWGCNLFYIHDNGFWWNAETTRPHEWLLPSSKVLRRVRQEHPDVLLIPARSEQNVRSVRASEYLRPLRSTRRQKREAPHPFASTLRGYGDWRIDGLRTPGWLVGNTFMLRHAIRTGVSHRRAVPGPTHLMHEAYWAHAAPYVEIKLKREIKEYLLTLDQHTQYSEEKAVKAAEEEIPWETTPAYIREWMPAAFSVSDVTGARVSLRQAELIYAGAWGDVLMWDVRQSPAKVVPVSRTARTKQQRFQGLAEELGLVAPDPTAPTLPLSLIWQRGEPLDPTDLLATAPVPEALRIRIARTDDGKRALLMIGWLGSPGRTVQLKPGLPGSGLPDGPKNIWQLPECAALGGDGPIEVSPDPVADVTAVLVQTATDEPVAASAGVLLGALFDTDATPQLGGRAPRREARDGPAHDARTQDGALVLGDGRAASYNVVPSWFEGSMEFDLKIDGDAGAPVRICTLRHHVDLELTCERRNGKTGLSLRANEDPIPVKVYEEPKRGRGRKRRRQAKEPKEEELPPPVPFEWRAFVPIPAGGRDWKHVVLTWEIGQYSLYVDGRKAASLEAAPEMRRRDGTVLEPGLVMGGGDGGNKSRLLLDNLFVYDWALSPEAAAGRRAERSTQPLRREADQTAKVWLWGRFPKGAQVGVNIRNTPNWNGIKKFRITLYERLGGGKQQVGQIDMGVYGGVAVGDIPYKRLDEIVGGDGLAMENTVETFERTGGMALEEELDLLDEVGRSMGESTEFRIEIQPLPENDELPTYAVNFAARRDGIDPHRWTGETR